MRHFVMFLVLIFSAQLTHAGLLDELLKVNDYLEKVEANSNYMQELSDSCSNQKDVMKGIDKCINSVNLYMHICDVVGQSVMKILGTEHDHPAQTYFAIATNVYNGFMHIAIAKNKLYKIAGNFDNDYKVNSGVEEFKQKMLSLKDRHENFLKILYHLSLAPKAKGNLPDKIEEEKEKK